MFNPVGFQTRLGVRNSNSTQGDTDFLPQFLMSETALRERRPHLLGASDLQLGTLAASNLAVCHVYTRHGNVIMNKLKNIDSVNFTKLLFCRKCSKRAPFILCSRLFCPLLKLLALYCVHVGDFMHANYPTSHK